MGWSHLLVTWWLVTASGQDFRPLPDSILRGQSFGLENFLMQNFNIGSQEEVPRRREIIKPSSSSSFRDPYTVEYHVQNHNNFRSDATIPFTPSEGIPKHGHNMPTAHMKPVHEDPESEDAAKVQVRRRPPPDGPKRVAYTRVVPDRRPLERPAEFQVTITEDDPPSTAFVAPPGMQNNGERTRKRVMKRRRKKPAADVQTEDEPLINNEEVKEIRVNVFPEVEEEAPNRPNIPHSIFATPVPDFQPIRRRRPVESSGEHNQLTPPVQEVVEEEKRPVPPVQRRRPGEGHVYGGMHGERLPPPSLRRKTSTEAPPENLFESLFDEIKEVNEPAPSREPEEPQGLGAFEEPKQAPPTPKQHRKPQGPKRYRDPIAETVAHLGALPDVIRPEEDPEGEASEKIKKEVADVEESEFFKTDAILYTTETPQEPTHRLKTLLKQQNGQLSLSEILQTQNLSLSDFLKGNPGALSALSANKVNVDKSTTPEPEKEKPKHQQTRPQIPKLSKNSRPFRKPNEETNRVVEPTTSENPYKDLPKKLDIIEVTSDRPTYNGFVPKNPKTRTYLGSRYDSRTTTSTESTSDEPSEEPKIDTHDDEEKEDNKEEVSDATLTSSSSTRSPVYRLTTPAKEVTITEQRVVPKRFGEYRPKQRVDRRKSTTDSSDPSTVPETTTEVKPTQIPKNKVRIPFMSVNNPEISVILNSRRVNVTEKPKERFSLHDRGRINLFKRLNTEQKQKEDDEDLTEETSTSTKTTSTTEEITQTTSTTSTTTTTSLPEEEPISRTTLKEIITTPTTTAEPLHDVFNESSDEIVELLKTGNNAKRLQRILEARNMTVGELLEKRSSSSKQPNVTHLFEKQTVQTTQKVIVPVTDNRHPITEEEEPIVPPTRTPKPRVRPEERPRTIRPHLETNSFDELFVDESMVQPIKINYEPDEKRESKSYETTVPKTVHRVQLNLSPGTEGKARHPVPLWNVDGKSIYNSNPYGYPTYDLNRNLAGNKTTKEQATQEQETLIVETVRRTEDTNSNLQSHINEILKEQVDVVKEVNTEEKTFIPPAVKSAIIASGVVMGIALIVFVAIFAACGWKQRQFRLRARSSILNDSLNGDGPKIKRTGTLSPISFKRSALYKKTIEFEDSDSSISGSSNTSSYLWNTLKHTFQSRNSTLKNRQEKEEKMQERQNRSRRNTLTREEDRPRADILDLPRRNTLTRDDFRRESTSLAREDARRESMTMHRDEGRRHSVMSRDTLTREFPREETRRNSMFRDDTRRMSSLHRDSDRNERCSFKKIDPERNIIQTSVNFKRGGFNGSSRHFDSCDHFN